MVSKQATNRPMNLDYAWKTKTLVIGSLITSCSRDCLTPALSHSLGPRSSTHQRYLLDEERYQPEKGTRHLATTESRVPKYQLRLKADLGRDFARHPCSSGRCGSERRSHRRWSSQTKPETHLHCPYEMVSIPGHFLPRVVVDLSKRMIPQLDGMRSDWR